MAHLVSSYLPITQRWIHAQIHAAPATDVLVLNCGPRLNESEFPVSEHASLGDLSAGECRREADGWEQSGVSPRLLSRAKRFKCDLIHAHFGPTGTVGVSLSHALAVPLVTSFYGYDVGILPRDSAWRAAYRRLFKQGTRFLAEGPVLAESLASLGCRRERIGLMPLPVHPAAAASRPVSDVPVVVICSRLVEKKGVDDSLRAIARLRDRSSTMFRVRVIGDGPERGHLVRLRAQLALEDVVEFAGTVPPSELADALRDATVLLQMSRTASDGDCEGGAPVILGDAAASGIPVVATRHCDIPHVVREGESGLLVECRDFDGAARALDTLLSDPALRERMSRSAREWASVELSPAACGVRLRQHYELAMIDGVHRRSAQRRPDRSPATIDLELSFRRRCGDREGIRRVLLRSGTRPDDAALGAALVLLQHRMDTAGDSLGLQRKLRLNLLQLVASSGAMARNRRGGTDRRHLRGLRRELWTLAYRMASAAEVGDAVDQAWARATFDKVWGAADLPSDLRGGAAFHLARLHLNTDREVARGYAAQCLVLIPGHLGAARLLDGHSEAA